MAARRSAPVAGMASTCSTTRRAHTMPGADILAVAAKWCSLLRGFFSLLRAYFEQQARTHGDDAQQAREGERGLATPRRWPIGDREDHTCSERAGEVRGCFCGDALATRATRQDRTRAGEASTDSGAQRPIAPMLHSTTL